jgi:hypothetical protein
MAEPLISGRGTSRFVVDTPSRALIKAEGLMQQSADRGAMRQNLLQQAASLLPDYQTLSDTLLEYDLPFADAQRVRGQLDGMTSAYMDAYGRDPFYAFTQEGRSMAKRMQKLVTQPELKMAQDLKKQNDKELDKALQEGVLDKVLVNAEGIAVLRNGRKQYVQKPLETDQILTVHDEYRYLNEVQGSAGGKYVVPMRSFDKAMQSVRNAFDKIGDTQWKQENIDPNGLLSSITSGKSNEKQISQAVDMLINKGGLSNEDWNTLKSEYLSSVASGQLQGEFTDSAAKRSVIEMVLSNAKKNVSTDAATTYDENPFIKAKKNAIDIEKGATLSGIERGFYGMNGTRPRAQVTPQGVVAANNARKIGAELFQTSTQEVYIDELGNRFKSHKIKDIPLTADAQETIYALAVKDGKTAKSGEFMRLPADIYRHGVIADGTTGEEDAPAFTSEYVGPDGKLIPYNVAQKILTIIERGDSKIPQEYRKYVTPDETGKPTLNVAQFMDAAVYVPKQRSVFGSSVDTSASTTMLEEHGYEMGYDKNSQDYINQHSGNATPIIKHTSDFGLNLEDGYYKVRVKIPVSSYFQIRGAGGEKVYTQLEDAHFDTGNFQKQGVPINPALLDDNAFLPNLKTNGLPKFSQFK